MTNKKQTTDNRKVELYRFEPFAGHYYDGVDSLKHHEREQLDPKAQNFVLDCFRGHSGQPSDTDFRLEQCFYATVQSHKTRLSEIRFYRADDAYNGYREYERSTRVVDIEFLTPGYENLHKDLLVDEGDIKMRLKLNTLGRVWLSKHEAPLYIRDRFNGCTHSDFEDMALLIAKDSGLTTEGVAEISEQSVFRFYEGEDSDSYDTERADFWSSACFRARSLLESPEQALKEAIEEAVSKRIRYLLPSSTVATITVSGDEATTVQIVKK